MLRSDLLRTLEVELRLILEPDDLTARLAEIAVHLDDGVAARLELGLSPEDAEREAVMSFGRVSVVAAPDRARRVGVRLRWMAAAYLGVLLSFLSSGWFTERWVYAPLLPVAFLLYGAAGLSLASFRARRAAPIPLATLGVVASFVIWSTMSLTTLNLWNYGDKGFILRWEAARLLRKNDVPSEARSSVVSAIPIAQADPLGNALSEAGPAFAPGMAIAGGAVLVDLIAAGLGAAWASRRRRHAHA